MLSDELVRRLRAGETLPADAVDLLQSDVFGTQTVGLVWDRISLERVTAHLDVDERHLQPFGLVHGGVWCAIVESTASFGAAVHAVVSGKQVVGVNNSTDFLRGVRAGRVDVEAVPLHVGRLQQLWQVDITRAEDGKLAARGQVRLQNVEVDAAG